MGDYQNITPAFLMLMGEAKVQIGAFDTKVGQLPLVELDTISWSTACTNIVCRF